MAWPWTHRDVLSTTLRTVPALAVLLLSACGQEATRPDAEVLAIQDCPAPRCISRQEAASELGFAIWEPVDLPAGFTIYARTIRTPRIGQSPPGTDPLQSPPGEAPPTLTTLQLPKTLYLEYRFHDSPNVAGIVVAESAHAGRGTKVKLRVRDQACGELVNGRQGELVYVNGSAITEPGASDDEWWICKVPEEPPRNSHTVVLTRGQVLIEVVAFPEAGVSKEDILRLAQSFVEAE